MKIQSKFFLISFFVGILSCQSSENDPVENSTSQPSESINKLVNNTSDASATQKTQLVFYNLKNNAGTKILVGHQDAFYTYYQDNTSMSDVKKATGSDPALIGLDLMFITDKNYQANASNWYYQQEQKIVAAAKEAYQKGMAVTFCWHLREPYNETTFYTSEMTASQKQNAFKSILPGGANHNWYLTKLQKVASVFKNLKGSGGEEIPVIFRPFHEFDGDWFWWGAAYCTAEEYKQLWQFTVNYLRNTMNVHNVLYAFAPDASYTTSSAYLSRYPGDQYVDVLGMDNYYDFTAQTTAGANTANSKLKVISDLAIQKNKIAALTETGYSSQNNTARTSTHFTTLVHPAITSNNVKISYVCFWSNAGNTYYVPTPATPYATDFKNFTLKPQMALQTTIAGILYN
ncbi:glycoside hydrolase family 26 protein [Chryseobacterium mucoviscidosis]|uniref:Beta-mannosidase n=1 Tax=Chryseobacterium mucoviscidosis TaxID=1945581 RepID=A0A202CD52_9FLAO|nr:glycosyl hydrolase [Chryseobacterium mucoviscidosis]OVE61706.1 beta-mannosidase [Chryseobacterium mucoviscidosis]